MPWFWIAAATALVHVAAIARAILRPHRQPESRLAWILVMLLLPGLGLVAYLLVGETQVGRRRAERLRRALTALPDPGLVAGPAAGVKERFAGLSRVASSVNGYGPVSGQEIELMADSNAAIDRLVEDIGAARGHVHVSFYIWLADRNGLRVATALCDAARRGVTCRALADGLGSRDFIRSPHWRDMRAAGVHVGSALPIGNPLLRALRGRIDLRNHRKIVVIDGAITYVGSQNCADPEFRVKAKYAPWVDAMVRVVGPVARQNQHLFASDWMEQVDDPLRTLFDAPLPDAAAGSGSTAQVIGTGTTVRTSAMPEVFASLFHTARHELVVTTPYYVPDAQIQAALCASAHRGVPTTLVVPATNDSWIVAAASRSYYAELLDAGVRIFEFGGGLLHTKSVTVDGEVTLIGSANLDRRSFDLNYENNLLAFDPALTVVVRHRQDLYLGDSHEVLRAEVDAWPIRRRLWNNALAMFGPIL
ncbi:MAG: cardiolipin synthase [Planctomycetota bacterium]|nr:cardiolipin synthase [Planctomycetota bacterium]